MATSGSTLTRTQAFGSRTQLFIAIGVISVALAAIVLVMAVALGVAGEPAAPRSDGFQAPPNEHQHILRQYAAPVTDGFQAPPNEHQHILRQYTSVPAFKPYPEFKSYPDDGQR